MFQTVAAGEMIPFSDYYVWYQIPVVFSRHTWMKRLKPAKKPHKVARTMEPSVREVEVEVYNDIISSKRKT